MPVESGNPGGSPPSVVLVGPTVVPLVSAIPQVQALLDHPVIVGGLAVMARLSTAHRATQDLDTLRRRIEGEQNGLEILSAAGADVDAVGGLLETAAGPVRVDVLESGPHDRDREFTDSTDRLEAAAFVWAIETADPVVLIAREAPGSSVFVEAEALVALPGPLIAMKLKASVDRESAKEATDLLDVVLLATDPATIEAVDRQLRGATETLRADILEHLNYQLVQRSLNTRRLIAGLNRPGVDDNVIDAAREVLTGALTA